MLCGHYIWLCNNNFSTVWKEYEEICIFIRYDDIYPGEKNVLKKCLLWISTKQKQDPVIVAGSCFISRCWTALSLNSLSKIRPLFNFKGSNVSYGCARFAKISGRFAFCRKIRKTKKRFVISYWKGNFATRTSQKWTKE